MKIADSHHSDTQKRTSINCLGRLLDLSKPLIMGILNVTPDSFFDGGKFTEQKAIIEKAEQMLSTGAGIIDLGAQSTRPGASQISEKEELARIVPALEGIVKHFPDAVISVDTFRSAVAAQCLDLGASIVNDVSAGELDPDMFQLIADRNVPYIIMHMKGTPETMQAEPVYDDVVNEVTTYLGGKVTLLRMMGVNDVIVDPGFGFGKTVTHNYSLLKNLNMLHMLGCPVLAGLSRKSMICKVLKVTPDKALNGTTALHMAALLNGASILRVHDVAEAKEVVALYSAYQSS